MCSEVPERCALIIFSVFSAALSLLSPSVPRRAIRKELKKKQEAPVLQAMEKEMMKPTPDMGTLRSLITMATDEVGVEIGTDIVARCKDSLEEAELQVQTCFALLCFNGYFVHLFCPKSNGDAGVSQTE